MSELTTGTPAGWPENWSKASNIWMNGRYVPGGHIWVGDGPATPEDIAALVAYYPEGYEVDIQKSTLCGLLDLKWITRKDAIDDTKPWNRQGGWGSRYYMHQKVKPGVEFSEYDWETLEQKPIYHYPKGSEQLVKAVPGVCGEHHWVSMGDTYYDAHEGAEPGSEAAEQLGEGSYYLDTLNGWWDVQP